MRSLAWRLPEGGALPVAKTIPVVKAGQAADQASRGVKVADRKTSKGASRSTSQARGSKAASAAFDAASRAASMLGVRIRHARRVAHLTMTQVAERADCSESLISKIENGQATPSLAMLHRIAMALDTNIADLTREDAPTLGPVLREGHRPVMQTGGGIALERLVLAQRGGLLQANIHVVQPGAETDGQIVHAGEEVGYLLEGTLELRLGDERHLLHAGDAFTFSSQVPHGYSNPGSAVARILWVNTPATF